MALSKHINADRLVADSHDKKSNSKHHHLTGTDRNTLHSSYGARYGTAPIPKIPLCFQGHRRRCCLPNHPLMNSLSVIFLFVVTLEPMFTSIIDGSPVLNLASFVHTWMPEQADKLMMENMSKNLIDTDEYPATQHIHTRCVSILADLWHAPSAKQAIGTATTGSSEAIQLGGLAMKHPILFMGANAQVALEKFARYFEVECRLVPISVESKYRLDPKKAMEFVDENTIGVYVILGSTYTGHYEPVKEMSDMLDKYEAETGNYVPIHVDGASGGFFAPFATPQLEWDFKLPRVVSINTSGHKFGLAYVGVGWVVWRDKAHLPKDLIFELHYLGSVEYSFSLNFSRPAAPIIAQYFNFIHLGFEGYRNVALDDLRNARLLSRALEKSKYYTVLSDIHRKKAGIEAGIKDAVGMEDDVSVYEPGLPVVSFRFSDDFKKQNPDLQQKWIQTLLRSKGWIVPNYELAPALEQIEILRVVVRENMTEVVSHSHVLQYFFQADCFPSLSISLSLISWKSLRTSTKADSPTHALNALGHGHSGQSKTEHSHGKLEKGDGSKPSGTYAKQC
ncbi:glutamate decarboxylase [Gymnopus androsaceus JB14]|uniref:Glutamate decarboxylase n=1 Tax=Gymnopus androsaceus JB14 TaxID=1447944 RepID=A0A6A4I9C4_9AGAR|nr:glutamate decarboxylase [Gymnopus androsaceus JB14]